MLSHQIPSHKTSHHIMNEVHSMTLILYEGIRDHNVKVTLHYIKLLNMSYHYITLHYFTFGLQLQQLSYL